MPGDGHQASATKSLTGTVTHHAYPSLSVVIGGYTSLPANLPTKMEPVVFTSLFTSWFAARGQRRRPAPGQGLPTPLESLKTVPSLGHLDRSGPDRQGRDHQGRRQPDNIVIRRPGTGGVTVSGPVFPIPRLKLDAKIQTIKVITKRGATTRSDTNFPMGNLVRS